MNIKVTIGFIYALFYAFMGLMFLAAGIVSSSESLLIALFFGVLAIGCFGLGYISAKMPFKENI